MMNLFKKKKTIVSVGSLDPMHNKSRIVNKDINMIETVTVKDIHNAFNTEVDRLLQTCNIKNSLETDLQHLIDKQERLSNLGFKRTEISKKVSNENARLFFLKRDNEAKLKVINSIEYFQQRYPHYKFITKDSVNALCKKYGLIFGSVEQFIGDVPDKNLEDIENFKIKDDDVTYEKTYFSMYTSNSNDCTFRDMEIYNKSPSSYISTLDYRCTRKSFSIVAPIKDFNLDGMQLEDNELKRKPVVKDDPIVLQPVNHNGLFSYLIVTAWGEEASDPLVSNQNHN